MKIKILFIVNPISGGLNKTFIPSLIDKNLDHQKFDAQIVYTQYNGHATALAKQGLIDGFELITAVGGDGTINEVASVLESSGKTMAIVPCGSGNGLARTLKIPLNNSKAIARINSLNIIKIDTGVLNDHKFFNMAGMGFDAHISAHFAESEKRGFSGYIKSTFKEVKSYLPQVYHLNIDGKELTKTAFMLSIANSSQYGNNAHISPSASVQDGLLDICIIKPFSLYVFPALIYRMFSKTAHKCSYVEIIKGKEIIIKRERLGPIHTDGEPALVNETIKINIKPLSLNLVI